MTRASRAARPFAGALLVLFSVALGARCASKGGIPQSPSAEDLYREAQDEETKSVFPDHQIAVDTYQKVIDQFPYSPFAPLSEVGIADANFKKGDFAEAIERYREFEKRHPTHDLVPYAIYQRGMAYEALGDSIDRDQTPIENALAECSRLVQSYPASVYAKKARPEIQKLRRMLAERILYIGEFYLRQKDYESAADRFHSVAESYPDLDVAPRALYLEARARVGFHDGPRAQAAVTRLAEDYPDSTWTRAALNLLPPLR